MKRAEFVKDCESSQTFIRCLVGLSLMSDRRCQYTRAKWPDEPRARKRNLLTHVTANGSTTLTAAEKVAKAEYVDSNQ